MTIYSTVPLGSARSATRGADGRRAKRVAAVGGTPPPLHIYVCGCKVNGLSIYVAMKRAG